MNEAFSPEQILALGKALDILVEKYGPFDETEKQAIVEKLIRLAGEGGTDINDLVEKAWPHKRLSTG